MTRSSRDWICTFSGGQYWPADPRTEDVRIVDIAHSLAYQCRYTGHCRKYFSVAEHSVLVSEVVLPEHALAGLLHDAPEAYIHDISGPLKRSLPDYRRVEDLNWRVIAERFGLDYEMHPSIHQADVVVLLTEMKHLLPPLLWDHGMRGEPADVQIMCLPPEEAEELFLHRFYELTRGRSGYVYYGIDAFTVEGCAA